MAGGAGRAAAGWSEQGLQPLLPALQLDTTGLGDGEGNGTSLLHELGEFTPSRSSLALLNSSVQNQSLL